MTLDVHHPSPADVAPLGEGLSARRCRQRVTERDKSQQFHGDVFQGYSPFVFNSSARCPENSPAVRAVGPNSSVTVPMFALGQKRTSLSPAVITSRCSAEVRRDLPALFLQFSRLANM